MILKRTLSARQFFFFFWTVYPLDDDGDDDDDDFLNLLVPFGTHLNLATLLPWGS